LGVLIAPSAFPATSRPATPFVPTVSFAAPSFAAPSFAAPSFAAPALSTPPLSFSTWNPGFTFTPFGTPKPLTAVSAQKMDAATLARLTNADDLPLLNHAGLEATERLYDQGSFRNWNIQMAQKDIDAMNANPTAEKKISLQHHLCLWVSHRKDL
jgi:hypothetical protein